MAEVAELGAELRFKPLTFLTIASRGSSNLLR